MNPTPEQVARVRALAIEFTALAEELGWFKDQHAVEVPRTDCMAMPVFGDPERIIECAACGWSAGGPDVEATFWHTIPFGVVPSDLARVLRATDPNPEPEPEPAAVIEQEALFA